MPDTIKPEFHRLFVALSLPHAVKAEIGKAQNELRDALPNGSVRWASPQHFHLTLRFLGNVAVDRTHKLINKLRLACRDFPALQIRVERLGFFPERGFPRVIWTAISTNNTQLARLQSAIQSATLEFTAEPAEKEFTGHITLGRAKKIGRREANVLANFAENMQNRFFGEWTAETLQLFKSELLPDGPDHTIVATTPLGRTE
jgi:2'-5' RNA ligase